MQLAYSFVIQFCYCPSKSCVHCNKKYCYYLGGLGGIIMKPSKLTGNQRFSEVTLYSILFLLFFQLISDFVEAIYAFGLMGTSLPVETVFVLVLFSPVVLLLLRKGISGKPLILIGEVMLVSRVVEVMLDTRDKMIVAGIGVGCFVLKPSLLFYFFYSCSLFQKVPDGW